MGFSRSFLFKIVEGIQLFQEKKLKGLITVNFVFKQVL